jgi:hypothetical protein
LKLRPLPADRRGGRNGPGTLDRCERHFSSEDRLLGCRLGILPVRVGGRIALAVAGRKRIGGAGNCLAVLECVEAELDFAPPLLKFRVFRTLLRCRRLNGVVAMVDWAFSLAQSLYQIDAQLTRGLFRGARLPEAESNCRREQALAFCLRAGRVFY